ncbi:hypothetical protein MVEN_00507200 [Mycena venus]|uniref:DNA topoisomerase (ATP-hydrolyzing) n=1 Tax=Mycena venus TaxID=2733690 RepID=A0A8H6YNL3_9AGAR|nr:hypothetical protein MVEN_00507200 [Mycena venus]
MLEEFEDIMDFDMLSDDSEEYTDITSKPGATDCIEDLVTSFLFQLTRPSGSKARAGSETECESDDPDANTTAKRIPVELRVADRRGEGTLRTMRFPVKRATGSARPFARLFRVLDLMHEAVVDDVPATKRFCIFFFLSSFALTRRESDMYYKDVPLFKAQKVVDNLVDDLAATFELDRADLNVRATSKGLVCGSGLIIHLHSGEEVHANDTEGALIPVGEDIKAFTVAEDVEWVLIVEKDARRLPNPLPLPPRIAPVASRARAHHHCESLSVVSVQALTGRGRARQGKGYPDVAARQLVATLSTCLPRRIPLLGVVDGDPYGLDILSVYKYGSRAMAHEVEKLAAPRVKYLGVFASELASYGVDRDVLLPITKADEKKALAMLGRPIPAKWKKELSHMLHARRKAEIEVLATANALGRVDEKGTGMAMSDMDSPPVDKPEGKRLASFGQHAADEPRHQCSQRLRAGAISGGEDRGLCRAREGERWSRGVTGLKWMKRGLPLTLDCRIPNCCNITSGNADFWGSRKNNSRA